MAVHPRISDAEIPTSAPVFAKALTVVDRSQAAVLIDQWRAERRSPARRSNSLPYTVHGYLTALLCVVLRRSEPTVRTLFRTLLDFSPAQLDAVGIVPDAIVSIRDDARRALPSFRDWSVRAFECLDSAPDQPAQLTTLAEHDRIVRRRTRAQADAYQLASERLAIIVNRLVAGSIDPRYRHIGRGDLVVDESIFDTSTAEILFNGDERQRGSVYAGGYYRRDRANQVANQIDSKPASVLKKRGWGLGVTAISAVGPPDGLHSTPTLFTGLSIHPPTSGSLEGLREAVHYHQQNGFDARPAGSRARWPMITFDMGYLRPGLFEWQLAHRYAAVFTYPKNWNRDFWAVDQGSGDRLGPVQLSGAWYCPTAAEISLGRRQTVRTRDLLTADDWEARNTRLAALLPRLMGVDRRPVRRRARRGRPPAAPDGPVESTAKIVLSCPAALGNVRCTRWHNPDTAERLDLPLVSPPDTMPDYRCCTQPTVTVTLTDDQKRMQQLSHYAPGSFEHAIYYEAARAKTEQRFSVVKRRSVTGIGDLRYGPRREPAIKLILAVAFAAANIGEIERFEHEGPRPTESVARQWARLERDLGKPPQRMPNRT